jgi:predicted glycogen debranching enzyme
MPIPSVRLRPTREPEIVCVPTQSLAIDELLSKEWLLTNERGSYCASTVIGCNTSGYHGLLIGSPEPLVRRIMALSSCLESVLWNGQRLELSTFEFRGRLAPTGYAYLQEFRRDTGARWLFHLEPVDVRKAVYLARDSDTVVVEYAFEGVRAPVDFSLRPFVGLRDFHLLQNSGAPLVCEPVGDGLRVGYKVPAGAQTHNSAVLRLGCPDLHFESDPQWWFNFVYRAGRERGQYYTEDLWAPGSFAGHIERPGRIVFWARLTDAGQSREVPPVDSEAMKEDLRRHQTRLLRLAGAGGAQNLSPRQILCLAADQFVVKRRIAGTERATIVAGYPWFTDWGRDTFVSLPGLLLATGRHEEAGSVLCTFAAAVDQGMVPNRFDDRTGTAHFNSVDASLWFIHAAFEYLEATGDTGMFARDLLPAIEAIIEAYHRGTRFGIQADSDGLLMAGDASTQLTWMDAKYGGVAFTPRYGKAVEVNALWHNALRRLEKYWTEIRNPQSARRNSEYAALAAQVGRSFGRLFWNEQRGYLNDAVRPDGSIDASLRPNQIFAVSLPYAPPLTRAQQRAVVEVVERELLTPCGLRTLNRQDPAYKGRYEGSPRQRDEAYHQGTVWPYLVGPFVEAWLKVHDFSLEARARAKEMLQPLLQHLVEDGCLGSISEIFDGDPPQRPKGCWAQAWSVAELLRAYRMVADAR